MMKSLQNQAEDKQMSIGPSAFRPARRQTYFSNEETSVGKQTNNTKTISNSKVATLPKSAI